MKQVKLGQAITDYITWRAGVKQVAPMTLRGDKGTLSSLTKTLGDIYVHNITEEHMAKWAAANRGWAANTWNLALGRIGHFFDWCARARYLSRTADLLVALSTRKQVQKERIRVPANHFPQLLDAAQVVHPRNRAVLATGLYLFLRSGELRSLNVADAQLSKGLMKTVIHKSGGIFDEMPIVAELDTELRNWLTTYSVSVGTELRPEWPLFPGLKYSIHWQDKVHIAPEFRFGRAEQIAQDALAEIGYAAERGTREGMHTLRRSGARALFDRLCDDSYDGALRLVQSMLHHASSQTTEIYLGLNVDRHRRDSLLRGNKMFPTDATNVVELPLRKWAQW